MAIVMLIEVAGMTTEWHWCSFLNMGLHYFFRVDKKENKACERMQNEPCHFLMSSMMFRTVNSDVCWSQWSCLQTERSVLDAVCSGFDLPCTEEAPTCLETCGRMRECGRHRCMEHCHVGPCSTVCLHNLTHAVTHLKFFDTVGSVPIRNPLCSTLSGFKKKLDCRINSRS